MTLGNTKLQLLNAFTTVATTEANLGRLVGMDGRVRALPDSAYLQIVEIGDTATLRTEAENNSPAVLPRRPKPMPPGPTSRRSKSTWWPQLNLSGRTCDVYELQ